MTNIASPSTDDFYRHLQNELQGIRDAGLFKSERIITSPQSAQITLEDGREGVRWHRG